ncbi:MAG: AAA domain-containing protein [Thermoplasmata archaeon]|nr:AAA domain-containing protein [Thermoplasmata archaeon]
MGLEDDLYEELYELRENLREERRQASGRQQQVCSDEALREMAQRVPTKAEDFAAIEGVGQRFVELYGEDFLEVTRKYAITAANGSSIDAEAAQTLRELEKKLININKANRLLFQPKLSRKNAFDMTTLPGADIMGLVFGNKRSLKLVDSAKGPDAVKAYKHLNEIIREVNREQRDKGQYDLYVAYPFVEGKMPDGDLDIRAPLALFPVVLEKDTRVITLKMDDSRDAIYNNTLILGFIKAGGQNRPLPDNILEDYTAETFMSNLVDFYGNNGIRLEYENRFPEPFVEYKAGEFPKYSPGETRLVPNILIGKYPTYSSSIQKDFDGMLAGREINGILNDLIVDLNKSDFLSDFPLPLTEAEMEKKGLEASERDMFYINSLNSSQESILTAMDRGDEIVVQGPPGTGKSQVITGLITSAVMKGKTVLMVSEKKTALDVVYSRLGTLSKYCLQIDDVANKESFYKQLARMLEAGTPKTSCDVDSVSDSIDNDVLLLDNIADVMYKPGEFGIEPYKLYSMDRWLDLSDKRQFDEYKILKDNIEPSLLDLKYPVVKELHRKFADPTLMKNFDEYKRLVAKYPWMTQMKPDLSEYNIGEMKADLLDLEKQMSEWKSKGFMGKLFSKGKVTREATAMADRYFANYNEHTVNSVMDDPRVYFDGLDGYETYSARATVYGKLNADEKNYGDDILGVSGETKMSFTDSNDRIYDWILNDHLQKFDASHKDIMQEIWDFESIIADMDRKIAQKRELCRDKVEEVFQQNLKYITESKRRGDINRIIESKRKWNLNKFIGRYGYELFKGVRVWLLTPEVVSEILPLEMGIFDVLIFDEASQMYVEKGVPSIYRAKKVIVAGDHKQLRPSSLGVGRIEYESDEDDPEDDVSAALEEESLLDLARSRYDSILLNFHYRSKYEELIAFSNYAFYGGRLYVSPNVEEPERPPIEVFRVDGLWEDKSNMAEARKIVALLKEFLTTRKNNETVGVITFNSSQRDLISDVLDEECASDPSFGKIVNDEMRRFDNGEDVGLFIKNIESVQGDERDVIMFSIGYAKNSEGKLMQRFGWLNNRGGENRLNVAISRAKRKIMIVTSFEPEDLQVDNVKNDGPRILKKYLQYARAVSDGDRGLADSILQSFGDDRWSVPDEIGASKVADRVYSALTRKGYTVERNVGIGGYQIDLAVKQNNRYILGIECDSHLYTLDSSTRERDYHRQKYLESRGWSIHRVWTPGMWKNPEREISRIIEAIEKSNDRR